MDALPVVAICNLLAKPKYLKTMTQEINTEWRDLPTCPGCGIQDEDWWDGTAMKSDGDTEVSECPNCHTKYRTTMSITTDFTTEKISPANVQSPPTGGKEA